VVEVLVDKVEMRVHLREVLEERPLVILLVGQLLIMQVEVVEVLMLVEAHQKGQAVLIIVVVVVEAIQV
jgi:hypothetical protein